MTENVNNNIEFELEQMKEQMRDLKRLVGTKDLINQKLMRQVMAYKARWIRQYSKFQLFVLLPFIFLDFLLLQHLYGLSWLFYWSTVVICTISVVIDVYINRLNTEDYSSLPLLDLMTRLVNRQKHRRIQTLIGIPGATLWCVWFVSELRVAVGILGGIIGGIVGLLIAILLNNKAQRTDADAVRDIRKMIGE